MSCWGAACGCWRTSLAYDGERVDAPLLDQLEVILRHVADELALWRARALKAEAELKDGGGRAPTAGKPDPETKARGADLEQENKALRQPVEAARGRVHDLLSRLTFLEEQARDPAAAAARGAALGGGTAGVAGGAAGAERPGGGGAGAAGAPRSPAAKGVIAAGE